MRLPRFALGAVTRCRLDETPLGPAAAQIEPSEILTLRLRSHAEG
jgi:hypothetical protein